MYCMYIVLMYARYVGRVYPYVEYMHIKVKVYIRGGGGTLLSV